MSVWDNYECEGQMSLFDADIQSPAEIFYMTTGRTDYWQQSRNIIFNDDGIPVLVEKDNKCYSCFHEDQGKCWCKQSEHFEKYVPSKPCTYLDLC